MLAYSEVEGDMLPHLEDFLADYNRGQRERVDHVPEKTAVEDAIAVESSHPISTAIDAELPFRPSPEAKISSNPLKRAMAISVEEFKR